MRKLVVFLVLPAVVTAATGQDVKDKDEKGPRSITYKMEHLEAHGLKMISAKQQPTGLTFLFEFTKDVDPAQIWQLFPVPPSSATIVVGKKTETKLGPDLRAIFMCFDEENVLVDKKYPTSYQGEITGKSGDAFRLIIAGFDPKTSLTPIRKIEVRGPALGNPSEKKEEKK